MNGSGRTGHRRFVPLFLALLVVGLIAAPAGRAARAEAAAASRAGATAPSPAPAAKSADPAAADTPARTAAAAADPDATLARTGPRAGSALTALAGVAFAFGGLAVIAGARRRLTRPIL